MNLNIRLSNHQKKVLIIIFNSKTPEVGYSKSRIGDKMISAYDSMEKIKAIKTIDNNESEITEYGKQLLVFNGLLDDDGENLTSASKNLISEKLTFKDYL